SVTLHMLVEEGAHSLVKLLLNAACNPDARDSLNRTPLHIAILFGRSEIATELISSGASINYKDGNGMTPLRLAILRKSRDFIELL
ncbi:ankyrin, partial [Zopfia rhizophila CBS 207.26]